MVDALGLDEGRTAFVVLGGIGLAGGEEFALAFEDEGLVFAMGGDDDAEFFGELELLRGTPPLASVVAATPLVALALPHAAVQAFILGDGRVARGLEQVGTGRLIALREGAR